MERNLPVKARKSVIPAAGLGTRFLPITKALPKEMLPLVDRPIIQQVVEESFRSGIRDIVLVTSAGKEDIENYFDVSPGLEAHLKARGQERLLERVSRVSRMVDLAAVRQKEPQGLGHAILCARQFVGDEAFAVLLPDDIIDAEVPCLRQLMDVHERHPGAIVALMEVPPAETSRYGIIEGVEVEPGVFAIRRLVEKPEPGKAPSNLAVIGRYLLPPGIFAAIEGSKRGRGGEIQLTDALDDLAGQDMVFGLKFKGVRHDAGDKLGFLKANIHYALKEAALRDGLMDYMRELVGGRAK